MSELDTKLYDAMGQRFSVIRDKVACEYIVTANPEQYKRKKVLSKNLKYSEAHAILKLLGENNGET